MLKEVDLENYRLDYVDTGSKTLVVSFESMTPSQTNPSRDRRGWGYGFLSKRSESILYVKPTSPNWYRRPDLHLWISENRALFAAYDNVLSIGSSMGGFGALSLADAIMAKRVLAFNPQTTLSRKIVPWETRFSIAWGEDWGGDFHDSAAATNRDTIIVCDRYEKEDMAHARRIPQSTFVNFPFVGHKIPAWLVQLDALKPITSAFLDNMPSAEINATARTNIRRRRELEMWWATLYGVAKSRSQSHRLDRFVSRDGLAGLIQMKEPEKKLIEQTKVFREYVLATGK